jgi:hypothetical protein
LTHQTLAPPGCLSAELHMQRPAHRISDAHAVLVLPQPFWSDFHCDIVRTANCSYF